MSVKPPPRKDDSPRILAVKRRIQRLDLICSGTLLKRTKVCGKPNCACASDPEARHGPYCEWNRRENDSLRHRIVSPEEAARIQHAMDNYQLILRLMGDWEDESARIMLGANRLSHRSTKR